MAYLRLPLHANSESCRLNTPGASQLGLNPGSYPHMCLSCFQCQHFDVFSVFLKTGPIPFCGKSQALLLVGELNGRMASVPVFFGRPKELAVEFQLCLAPCNLPNTYRSQHWGKHSVFQLKATLLLFLHQDLSGVDPGWGGRDQHVLHLRCTPNTGNCRNPGSTTVRVVPRTPWSRTVKSASWPLRHMSLKRWSEMKFWNRCQLNECFETV